jgi:branched-chain amino acid transport system substrate-binding protein
MASHRRWTAGIAAMAALACGAAPAAAQELTIYSSLPLSGAQGPVSRAVVEGERLALEQAGNRAGAFGIRFVSMNDATRKAGSWTPERVSRNARRAAADDTAIGYVGEFNSGATAISLPILNEAGIPQVSPSNTAVGLTRQGPGADRGEPDKYYPTGMRTFARVVPADHVQSAALARLVQELGARRVYLVDDREVYGAGIRRGVAAALKARGIAVAGRSTLRRGGRNAASIARRVRRSKAGAMVYGGITANGAPRLFRAVARRAPRAQLLAGDGVAEEDFADRLGRRARRRTRITVATLPPSAYPPAAQPVFQALRERSGGRDPNPYALYGYEAMSVLLDAIRRAGDRGNDKEAVRAQLLATRDRDSVLGRYSIDRLGDTTLTHYGVYRVAGGSFAWDRAVDAAAP